MLTSIMNDTELKDFESLCFVTFFYNATHDNDWHFNCNDKCHYAECHHARCCCSECHYAGCRYAEYCYAGCALSFIV